MAIPLEEVRVGRFYVGGKDGRLRQVYAVNRTPPNFDAPDEPMNDWVVLWRGQKGEQPCQSLLSPDLRGLGRPGGAYA